MGLDASKDVRATGPEPRVYVMVSAPGGINPEDTAQKIAHAVRKVAAGADVYINTTEEES